MPLVALIAWLCTVSIGLYLLAIWLIEYDREFQSAAATRLPVPVISAHALLAFGGLAVWALYLITDRAGLAWVAASTLGVVALLGLAMAVRWIGVYRAHSAPSPAPAVLVPVPFSAFSRSRAGTGTETAVGAGIVTVPVPPERHFPLPVVIAHGTFAAATIFLVLLTAFVGS
jgi:hypothetical protein